MKKNKRMAADTDKQSFWEHLDVLRAAIVKSLLVAVVFGVAAFCFKEELFAVILAPKDADFITYRLLYSLGGLVTEPCAGFSREAHQHGTGWAVHHPHESRTMCRCSLCIAIHPLPVVSLRIACFIC